MTKKSPISWVKQPVSCRHSPLGFHYIHLGFIDQQVVHLTCDCKESQGLAFCAVEYEMTQEFYTCFAAMKDIRNMLKKSYTSGAKRHGLVKARSNLREHIPALKPQLDQGSTEHWFISLLLSFNEEANKVRGNKVRPYKHYRPRSYTSRKAFLLEKFVRRHMGDLAPMFHVHPHEEDEKLVLRMGTTKILTCGLDLESQRRKHQSWTASRHKFYHSNSGSRDCLFCGRAFYNMGSHTIGQGHIKRVAEAVNRARRIMSSEGIKGAAIHEQGVSFRT